MAEKQPARRTGEAHGAKRTHAVPVSEPLPAGRVDRRTFAKLVGIHDGTVTTWVREGIVTPSTSTDNKRHPQLFSPRDVAFGRALRTLMSGRHGELKLRDAAAIVRGELELPELGHDPKKPPRPL